MAKRATNWRAVARAEAKRAGISPAVFERQINRESGFRVDARSPAGALGIAQIMPETAKGWGVDPLNPRAALRAAATNMARYVQKYGSYEKALRAYNAGEGAIEKSKGYRETNEYVAAILGGKEPSAPTAASPVPATRARVSARASAVDRRAIMRQTIAQGVLTNQSILSSVRAANDAIAQEIAQEPLPRANIPGSTPSGASSGPVRPSGAKGPVVKELFYDPVGAWDEGTRIAPIGGHSDHIHVAARSKGAIRAIARRAQRMGLTVRELEGFDPVDPVHTKGSHHYSGTAADLSGDPAKMKTFVAWARKRYGLR